MILVIRLNFDAATNTSYNWCQEIIDALKSRAFDFQELSGDDATRGKFEDLFGKNEAILLIFYGHGSSFELIGQDEDIDSDSHIPILDPLNAPNFDISFIYAFACHSARGLGKYLIKNEKTKCTIGYLNAVSWHKDFKNDFGECFNSGILAMINDGADSQHGVNETKSQFQIKFDDFLDRSRKEPDPFMKDNLLIAASLFNANEKYITLLGRSDFTFT